MSTTKDDVAYFCPSCGSPAIVSSSLVGGVAHCDKCQWNGINTDLVAYDFKHEYDSGDAVALAFANDVRAFFTANAVGLARVLLKWGFFHKETPTPPELVRYLMAITKAVITAVLEERRMIEFDREPDNGSRN